MAWGSKSHSTRLDSTTIDLCLTLFPWADFRSTKAAVKAHTIIDLRGAIPVFVHITTGKVHDVNILDLIHWPAGAIVVIDRGYLDFASDSKRCINDKSPSSSAPRTTCATPGRPRARSTNPLDCAAIRLSCSSHRNRNSPTRTACAGFPFAIQKQTSTSCSCTNRFDLPALTIAEIYRKRWQVELFFKWIKQNLSIKHFLGNSINAVKSQIWIAVCVYLIVIIARKRLNLPASPQILLNIFEVNMFEKITIDQLVTDAMLNFDDTAISITR